MNDCPFRSSRRSWEREEIRYICWILQTGIWWIQWSKARANWTKIKNKGSHEHVSFTGNECLLNYCMFNFDFSCLDKIDPKIVLVANLTERPRINVKNNSSLYSMQLPKMFRSIWFIFSCIKFVFNNQSIL